MSYVRFSILCSPHTSNTQYDSGEAFILNSCLHFEKRCVPETSNRITKFKSKSITIRCTMRTNESVWFSPKTHFFAKNGFSFVIKCTSMKISNFACPSKILQIPKILQRNFITHTKKEIMLFFRVIYSVSWIKRKSMFMTFLSRLSSK